MGHTFSSKVTNISYSGLPVGASRAVIVHSSGIKKEYACNLKKHDFDEAMSLLIAYSNIANGTNNNPEGATNAETPIFQGTKRFTLEEDNILMKNILGKAPLFVIFEILLIWLLYIVSTGIQDSSSTDAKLFCIILMLIVAVVYAFNVFINVVGARSNMPTEIIIDAQKLQIDGTIYDISNITLVSMTPPSYLTHNKHRILVIKDDIGKKHKYWLGQAKLKKSTYFYEYEELATTLELIFANTPGLFRYDL